MQTNYKFHFVCVNFHVHKHVYANLLAFAYVYVIFFFVQTYTNAFKFNKYICKFSIYVSKFVVINVTLDKTDNYQ